MTPRELLEMAEMYGAGDKPITLWDGDNAWVLEENMIALLDNGDKGSSLTIKQV